RIARDCARDGEGAPQGRACEVLRRRHLAQAQAAREPKEGEEADEAGQRGGGATGSVPRRAQHRAGELEKLMALEMPSVSERCGAALEPDGEARICSFECT